MSNSAYHLDNGDEEFEGDDITETSEYSVDIREIRHRHKSEAYRRVLGRFRITLKSQLDRVQRKQFDSGDSSGEESTLEWLDRLQRRRQMAPAIEAPSDHAHDVADGRDNENIETRDLRTIPAGFADDLLSLPALAFSSLSESGMASLQAARPEDSASAAALVVSPGTKALLRSLAKHPISTLEYDDEPVMGSVVEGAAGSVGVPPSEGGRERKFEDAGPGGGSLVKTTRQCELKQMFRAKGLSRQLHAYKQEQNIETDQGITKKTTEFVEETKVTSSADGPRKNDAKEPSDRSSSPGVMSVLRKQLDNLMSSIRDPSQAAADAAGPEQLTDCRRPPVSPPQRTREKPRSLPAAVSVRQQTGNQQRDSDSNKGKDETNNYRQRIGESTHQERNLTTGQDTASVDGARADGSQNVKMFGKLASGKRRVSKQIPRRTRIKKSSSSSECDERKMDSLDSLLKTFVSLDKENVKPAFSKASEVTSHFRQSARVVKQVKKRSRAKSEKVSDGNGADTCSDLPDEKRAKRSNSSDSSVADEVTTVEKVFHRVQKGQTCSTRRFYRKRHQKRSSAARKRQSDPNGKRAKDLTGKPKQTRVRDQSLSAKGLQNSVSVEDLHCLVADPSSNVRTSETSPTHEDEGGTLKSPAANRLVVPEFLSTASDKPRCPEVVNVKSPDEGAESGSTAHPRAKDQVPNTGKEITASAAKQRRNVSVSRTPLLKLKGELHRKRMDRRSTSPSSLDLSDGLPRRLFKLKSKTISVFLTAVLLILIIAVTMRLVFFCSATDRCWRCDVEFAVGRMIDSHASIYHVMQPPI